ncbi:MAG: peptidase MA family metallohydrolase, partial [Verrucomicrobiota bacterium]
MTDALPTVVRSPAPGWARLWMILALVLGGSPAVAQEPDTNALAQTRRQINTGLYAEAIEAARAAIGQGVRGEEWPLLLAESLLTTGQALEARDAVTNALARESRSLRLRLAGREACLRVGRTNEAADYLREMGYLIGNVPAAFRDPAATVAAGRAALLLGADPKDVLQKLYEPVARLAPTLRDGYLARGELALDKHDAPLAARIFDEGLKLLPEDPDLLAGRARAFEGGSRTEQIASLEAALKINPRHVPTLLVLIDHQIDAEDYAGARRLLDQVRQVHAAHPEAWAYAAVIAHLQADPGGEKKARDEALAGWAGNPRVDHLIGRKLSQKYRFAEGAAAQRRALALDPGHLPAKAQLASDLLRLGELAEGWRLAQEVQHLDGYDVAAFNLATLHDTMDRFAVLTNADFSVRMESREAGIYGPRVLRLLQDAHDRLVPRYGVQLARPTWVEIFPSQKDFAVRTFAVPENPGFLGVCFGRVITANSPAANRGHPVNWEAVLWHEFCHSVTLQLTRNKMPRWLSEGISVYEERQAHPSWGQHLNPRYRDMILRGELTPVARLSAAFLIPKSDLHLQFAYFQASWVVEYLVEKHGFDALKAVLNDLGEGVFINDALARRTVALDEFEQGFTAYARARAEAYGPSLDWEKPAGPGLAGESRPAGRRDRPPAAPRLNPGLDETELTRWIGLRPTNFWALQLRAQRAMEKKQWAEARTVLEELAGRCPEQRGPEGAWAALARVCRELGD